MAWSRFTWVDDDGSLTTGSAFSAARMNNIEEGIEERNSYLIVRLATAAALAANTQTGNKLEANAVGSLTVDSVAVAVGNRILVKNESGAHQKDGIYTVIKAGGGAEKWVLERSSDMNLAAKFIRGQFITVMEGTSNGMTVWSLTTAQPITLNTTTLNYEAAIRLGSLQNGARVQFLQLSPAEEIKDYGLRETLPSSPAPAKGDRCKFVANKTNGVIWDLVYDGEGEFPWKKVGGPPLREFVAGTGVRKATTYGDCTAGTTTVPSVTTPLAGDYIVRHGCFCQLAAGTSSNGDTSIEVGAVAPTEADSIRQVAIDTFEGGSGGTGPLLKTGLAASTAIKQKYRVQASETNWEFKNRWVEIDPVRVG